MPSPRHLGVVAFGLSLVALSLLTTWSRVGTTRPWSIRSGSLASMSAVANDALGLENRNQENVELGVRIVVSLVVLAAALSVIVSKRYDSDQQKRGFGSIGTILEYWLKS